MTQPQQVDVRASDIQMVDVSSLVPNPKNPNKHPEKQIERLMKLIQYQGFRNPIIVSERTGFMVVGHGRLEAAKRLGMTQVPVIRQHFDDEAMEYAYLVSDNTIADWAETDLSQINVDMLDLGPDFDVDLLGIEDFVIEPVEKYDSGVSLSDKFLVPPFSILDMRQGYWQDRKRWWKEKINDKGESRQGTLGSSKKAEGTWGKLNGEDITVAPNVSILDPVLAEVLLKWFCPPEGHVVDPFAGDTVFGYVAGYTGHTFTGIELRQEQVDINNARTDGMSCRYVCDDGQNVRKHVEAECMDMIFSCPPYYDLEVYSDDDRDASNQGSYEEFLLILKNALQAAVETLKPNRFACITIGDVRDPRGAYRLMPDHFKQIMLEAGCVYYNDLILAESIGTAAMRADRTFNSLRKVIKTHQNVLVFYKGDIREIKNEFPRLEAEVPSES